VRAVASAGTMVVGICRTVSYMHQATRSLLVRTHRRKIHMLRRSVKELMRVRTSLADAMFAKRQASLGRGLTRRDARLEACESGAVVTPDANYHDVVGANDGTS